MKYKSIQEASKHKDININKHIGIKETKKQTNHQQHIKQTYKI